MMEANLIPSQRRYFLGMQEVKQLNKKATIDKKETKGI